MKKFKKNNEITIRSSCAEYLTYVSVVGEDADSIEMRYEDENIWLTQKMMAELYDVTVAAINQHIKKVFEDGELTENSVIKKYLITASAGKISMEIATKHAFTQFEKYRVVQDKLYKNDFDKLLEETERIKEQET